MAIDLGALFQPQVQGAVSQNSEKPPSQTLSPDTAPDLKSQWDAFLGNPTNRAALLGFGIQALSGGWGGFGSQFGQAIGAGAEAAGGVEAHRLAQEEKTADNARQDRALEQQATLQRESLASQERRTKLLSDTRLSTAAMRSGPRNLAEQRLYQTVIQQEIKRLTDAQADPLTGLPIEGALDADEIQALAEQRALMRLEAGRNYSGQTPQQGQGAAPVPSQGGSAPLPGGPSPANVGAPAATGQSAPSTPPQQPITRQVRNKATGAIETLQLINGQWVKVGQ
jgi:hypothetical protein